MADLYGTTPPTAGHEPEEISSFLNQFIHNSSSSSSSCFFAQPEDRHPFGRSADPSVLDSSSAGLNFSNLVVGAVDSDTNDSEVVLFVLSFFFKKKSINILISNQKKNTSEVYYYYYYFECRRVLMHWRCHRTTRFELKRRLNGAGLLKFIICQKRFPFKLEFSFFPFVLLKVEFLLYLFVHGLC